MGGGPAKKVQFTEISSELGMDSSGCQASRIHESADLREVTLCEV